MPTAPSVPHPPGVQNHVVDCESPPEREISSLAREREVGPETGQSRSGIQADGSVWLRTIMGRRREGCRTLLLAPTAWADCNGETDGPEQAGRESSIKVLKHSRVSCTLGCVCWAGRSALMSGSTGLGSDRWVSGEVMHQPAVVVPVHPVGGDHLQVRQPLQRSSAGRRAGSDAFMLVKPVRGLRKGTVERIADGAD